MTMGTNNNSINNNSINNYSNNSFSTNPILINSCMKVRQAVGVMKHQLFNNIKISLNP